MAANFPASPMDAVSAVPLRRGRSYPASVSVSMPADVLAAVDDAAEAAGMSRSKWIAEAVAQVVGSEHRSVEYR